MQIVFSWSDVTTFFRSIPSDRLNEKDAPFPMRPPLIVTVRLVLPQKHDMAQGRLLAARNRIVPRTLFRPRRPLLRIRPARSSPWTGKPRSCRPR